MDKMHHGIVAMLLPHTDFSGNVFGNPTEINNFPYLKKTMETVLNDKLVGKNLIYGILLAIEYRKDLQNVLTFVEGKLFFRNLDCKSGNHGMKIQYVLQD
ncbi:hypothetical protein [Paenibacillus peoriae]|uniref:hypothetical protein n=1 Tax=Paenibacillus peoriae TaxID=59893 RepID=UPI00096EB51E|nr:hypothetical protein [Paenibacillus peoriae]OMF50683.1 hypothetical protein BK135_00030 [Paenibacillus peoriae]